MDICQQNDDGSEYHVTEYLADHLRRPPLLVGFPEGNQVLYAPEPSGGYSESGFLGCSKKANRPNNSIERIASHHGWKTIGKRTKKMANTTHRHMGTSLIYAALSLLRCT
jgi:hypothetical protein